MNDFGEIHQGHVTIQRESFNEGFKCAVFAMMRELCSEHIERNTVFDCLAIGYEVEARTFINELLY